jgi:hypothetical protein
LSEREEVLDMAVHALAPLMRSRRQASAYDLFDEAVDIAQKLIAKVDETALQGGPPRDELLDMGIHALSALLNGRPSASADDLLDECMAVAGALIARVDEAIAAGNSTAERDELMDVAVHVQTALLSNRPKADAGALSAQCVAISEKLIANVDEAAARGR